MTSHRWFLFVLPLIFFSISTPVSAHQPVFEAHLNQGTKSSDPYDLYGSAMLLGDPLFSSYAVYGKLTSPDAVDMYVFVPQAEDVIPVELLIPAKVSLSDFRPTLMIIGKYVANGVRNQTAIPVPIGMESVTVPSPVSSPRPTVYEPWSFQKFYSGEKQDLHVFGGGTYYLAVFDLNGQTGNYVLGVGAKENFSASVKDTATAVDVNTLTFEGHPQRQANTPSPFENRVLTEQKTPFQTFDSKLRLWIDLLFFYANRIGDLFTN